MNTEFNRILKEKHTVFVTRKVHFSAAHRLFNPEFSDAENELIYDRCNNIYGHGHNYELEVTLKGPVDKATGYVFDLKKLDKILSEEILSKVDHKHLNFDVEMLKDMIPSAEVLSIVFWNAIQNRLSELGYTQVALYEVKLFESERNFVRYRGD
ncbi:6-pyruvoyl tetrahydropterin synthase and hypothetical protein [Chloroherpeton thalassium ATCC 35110]|uniref:6-carboxy-5,6,7,8-tetrahydropterin synthase n=1 Tax=Chloroherpeton thalassium (strain ATCC 35110 / GB-78) TaxID=517418 RepID=B3QUQ1_CHLT3|nr:6-carboxytetrahydropterin synthase [Chloroherpeton thalassium]ACF12957.1 6-pyruvoyl tetrahydropterin synthase and hypothetical protein [Chloroherpeton thalassium ATCC 35110]